MPKSVRIGTAVACAVAALALAACGDEVVDDAKAEDVITDDLEQAGLQVESVDCPEDVDVEPGTLYRCDVTLRRGEGVYTLRIRNEDADVSFVSFRRSQ